MPQLLLVDFKWAKDKKNTDENALKIARVLEFGCGINSAYSGYAIAHQSHQSEGDILYRMVFNKIGQNYDRVIFGHKEFVTSRLDDTIHKLNQQTPGKYSKLWVGKPEEMSYAYADPYKLNDNTQSVLKNLSSKDCILIPGFFSEECMTFACQLDNYLKNYNIPADVINSHSSVIALTQDKAVYAYLDQSEHLKTELVRLGSLSQIKKTQKMMDVPGDKLVIKPTSAEGGKGVIVIDKKDLPHYLNFIFWIQTSKPTQEEIAEVIERTKLNIDSAHKSIQYWKNSFASREGKDFVLIQEFKESKAIDDYDPTGRMVFMVDNEANVKFVDGYWKFPLHTQNAMVPESNKHVSDFNTNGSLSRKISEEDSKAIQASLAPVISRIVKKATQQSLPELINQMKNDPDEDFRDYAKIVLEKKFSEILKTVSPVIPQAQPIPVMSNSAHSFVAFRNDFKNDAEVESEQTLKKKRLS